MNNLPTLGEFGKTMRPFKRKIFFTLIDLPFTYAFALWLFGYYELRDTYKENEKNKK